MSNNNSLITHMYNRTTAVCTLTGWPKK